MTDFTVFETNTAEDQGVHEAEHEGAEHEGAEHLEVPEKFEHVSDDGHHNGHHDGNHKLTNRLMAYIPDELFVIACFLGVFTICLAAMLPWYYASINLINSGLISTPNVVNGMSVQASIKTLDPLALAATLGLESSFLGCTNVAEYYDPQNSTIPQIDESLDLFYMDVECLNVISGYHWTSIDDENIDMPQVVLGASVGKASKVYSPWDESVDADTVVRLKEVKSYQNYPFDSYTGQLIVTSFINANGTIVNRSGTFPVTGQFKTPTSVTFQSNAVGFTVSFRIMTATSNLANTTSAIVFMDISRSSFTQGLSLFIVIVMWGISLGITVLSLDSTYIRHHKPVSLGMAGLCATMLFALPSLRAVQPGIPPIALYSTIDIFSYFMNMALISASLILLLIKIIAENKDPKANIKKRSMSIGRNSSSKRYLSPRPISNIQGQTIESMRSKQQSQMPLTSRRGTAMEPNPPEATPTSSIFLRVNS